MITRRMFISGRRRPGACRRSRSRPREGRCLLRPAGAVQLGGAAGLGGSACRSALTTRMFRATANSSTRSITTPHQQIRYPPGRLHPARRRIPIRCSCSMSGAMPWSRCACSSCAMASRAKCSTAPRCSPMATPTFAKALTEDTGFAGFRVMRHDNAAGLDLLPRRVLFPHHRRDHAIWPVRARAGAQYRHAGAGGISPLHQFLDRAAGGPGRHPDLCAARKPQRQRRLSHQGDPRTSARSRRSTWCCMRARTFTGSASRR